MHPLKPCVVGLVCCSGVYAAEPAKPQPARPLPPQILPQPPRARPAIPVPPRLGPNIRILPPLVQPMPAPQRRGILLAPLPLEDRSHWLKREFNGITFYVIPLSTR